MTQRHRPAYAMCTGRPLRATPVSDDEVYYYATRVDAVLASGAAQVSDTQWRGSNVTAYNRTPTRWCGPGPVEVLRLTVAAQERRDPGTT